MLMFISLLTAFMFGILLTLAYTLTLPSKQKPSYEILIGWTPEASVYWVILPTGDNHEFDTFAELSEFCNDYLNPFDTTIDAVKAKHYLPSAYMNPY